jgi:oligopeptide/dipeptide ABC transporter ATP-binding protein
VSELLRVSSLDVRFDTARGLLHAVKDVSFNLEPGESLGIVGESGSGKTVLSRATMGLLTMSTAKKSGSVKLNDVELTQLSRTDLRSTWGTEMAIVFQDPMTALNPVRRIGDQIAEGPRVRLGMSKKAAKQRSIELLKMVQIAEPEKVLKKFPLQLSGGMRQRVMIAIAIACNPKILFADEPTTALDVTVQAQILGLISSLRKQLNMSLILVTHDLGVAAGHTDKIAVMYAGEIVEIAPTKELFSNVRMPYTEALLNSIPRISSESGVRLPVIEGRLPDPTLPQNGCGFSVRCKYATEKCHTERPQLVDGGNGHMYRCFFPLGVNK